MDENDKARAGALPADPLADAKPYKTPLDEDRENSVPMIGFALTDMGNAERLVARWRDSLRYCPPRRRWLVYDGKRWGWDETGVISRMAKRTVRAIYGEAEKCIGDDDRRRAIGKHARDSEKAARIAAMIQLAATEPGVAVMPDELDADPWLFNVENGTLELKTATLRPHDRRDMITKIAPVAFDPAARLELWDRFLKEATGGDDDLSAYLRRMVGYCLTGTTGERKFFFGYGQTSTSKSTFLDAIAGTFGDYHRGADFATWLEQTNVGGNRGDLVRLAGARLVTSAEVRKGKRWDEALVKRVVGGDQITAAAKFESEITFRARFKILLAANDAPGARDDDDGLWARMQRVPFVVQIPPERRDPTVKERLSDPEIAGAAILAWAVRGCLEWQRDGLGSCAAVEQSTANYRSEVDAVAGFFTECCAFDDWDEVRVSRKELRRAYEDWCSENGIRHPVGAKDFAARLRERGAVEGKVMGNRIWKRVRLLAPDEDPAGAIGAHRGTSPREVPTYTAHEGRLETGAPSCPYVPLFDDPEERAAIQAE